MKKNTRIKLSAAAALVLAANLVMPLKAEAKEEVEVRKNKKGVVSQWIYRKDGEIYKREYDRNGDGKPDFRVIEKQGRLVRKEYDNNFDGKFEKTERPLAHGSTGRIKTVDTENQVSG